MTMDTNNNNNYVELDKLESYKDASERKEEILKNKFGDFYNEKLLEIRHELKYDVSFAALIEPSDAWKVERFRQVMYYPTTTEEQREMCINWLYNFFSKYYNDQKTGLDYDLFPKPIQINRAFDRCVNIGLRRTAQLITGKSTRYFTHYAWGEGTAKVLPNDKKLQLQVAVSDMNLHGFAEPRGSDIAFFSRFLENIPTAFVNESGILDSDSSTATLFLRTRYGGTPMQHLFLQDQVILMHMVFQLSV
jgi:hypothetical protein